MSKDKNKRYAALEITSKSVRLVYGYFQDNKVHVLHALETSINALDGGIVTDMDQVTNAVKGVINALNETLQIKVKDVIVCLPPMGLVYYRESGSTATIGVDNVIVQIDINNAINQLRKHRFSEGTKIVDIVPFQFVLDNKDFSQVPPIGKTSQSLTVHASIFALDESLVNGYVKAIENAGLFIQQLVIAPYASSLYMSNEDEIPSSYYLLNFGSDITTLTQISQNTLVYQNACFKFGSDRITQCIADRFDLSLKEAKMLKEKYGIDKSPSYNVNIYKNITLDQLTNVICDAIEPLIAAIKNQISSWSSTDHRYLPIVITGGGSKLNNIKALLEKNLELQVIDYTPYSFGARDKTYQNCLGLIYYAGVHLVNDDLDELTNTTISRVMPKTTNRKNLTQYNFDEEL